MATAVQVAGPCACYISYPGLSSGVPQLLGYTRNGAQVSEQGYFLNVPGDQNGGDEGPPIEIQWLGETARIILELTTFDKTVCDYIRRFLDATTLGTPAGAGSLMFSASLTGRLTLKPTLLTGMGAPVNFPRVFTREPIEVNRGSKHAVLFLGFEAHKDGSGVLHNESITGIS